MRQTPMNTKTTKWLKCAWNVFADCSYAHLFHTTPLYNDDAMYALHLYFAITKIWLLTMRTSRQIDWIYIIANRTFLFLHKYLPLFKNSQPNISINVNFHATLHSVFWYFNCKVINLERKKQYRWIKFTIESYWLINYPAFCPQC